MSSVGRQAGSLPWKKALVKSKMEFIGQRLGELMGPKSTGLRTIMCVCVEGKNEVNFGY